MNFQISGLDTGKFSHLFGAAPEVLARHGAVRMKANSQPGFPCRISLRDVEPGESVLLMNYEHLPGPSPFRSRHAIFVHEGASPASIAQNQVPEMLKIRLLSVRAFDESGMMLDADVVDGSQLETVIERMLTEESVSFLHVHNAQRGCFMAKVERAATQSTDLSGSVESFQP